MGVNCIKFVHRVGSGHNKPDQRIHRLSGSTKRAGRIPRPPQIQAEALLGALPHPLLVIGKGVSGHYKPDQRIHRLSGSTKRAGRIPRPPQIQAEALLGALPHPLLVIGKGLKIDYVNTAAEDFFQMSAAVLCRRLLTDVVAFGSPLIALVEQVQRNGTTVNEYGVDLGSFRFEAPKLVDLYGGPVSEMPGRVLIMLQQRSMAQMIERQLTHRGAARSVSGLAAVLAHEIKNPLSGIRGAAQLLESERTDGDRTLTRLICAESDRICKLVDRMEIFGDERPIQREAV